MDISQSKAHNVTYCEFQLVLHFAFVICILTILPGVWHISETHSPYDIFPPAQQTQFRLPALEI